MRALRFGVVACLALWGVGCGKPTNDMLVGEETPPPEGCSDVDGDGYGVGRDCTGPDCNDRIASVHEEAECIAYCEDQPMRPGCPCDQEANPAPVTCYTGDAADVGRGPCQQGNIYCGAGGAWGPCEGEVLPASESCDYVDNDCDGDVDEDRGECGVCGECDERCVGGAGDGCEAWSSGAAQGLVEGAGNTLELDGEGRLRSLAWPMTVIGEIFRVDLQERTVEGTYHALPPWTAEATTLYSPSTPRVDWEGNFYVGVTESPYGAVDDTFVHVTKIAPDPSFCVDRNGDGIIQTSGAIDDRLPFTSPTEWEDECILYHAVVGETGPGHSFHGAPLALQKVPVLDGVEGHGWIGTVYSTAFEGDFARYYEFDLENGERLREIRAAVDYAAGGLVLDRDGWLWGTGDFSTARFDTADPEGTMEIVETVECVTGCLTVDEHNNVWAGLMPVTEMVRFNRERDSTEILALDVSPAILLADGRGSVWATTYDGADMRHLERFSVEGFEWVESYGESDAYSLGFDFEQNLWAFGLETYVYGPTGERTRAFEELDAAGSIGYFGCGDVTAVGYQGSLDEYGTYSYVAEGCAPTGPTEWASVVVEATVPEPSKLTLAVRTADTVEALAAADFLTLGEVEPGMTVVLPELLDVTEPDGRLMEVRLVAEAAGDVGPTLQGLRMAWGCPAPIK